MDADAGDDEADEEVADDAGASVAGANDAGTNDAVGDGTEQCWLVERTYTDRDLVVLVYATSDGERALRKEQAAAVVRRSNGDVTAAIQVETDRLDPVEDAETRERYAAEADRMADEHDPDDAV